MNEIIEYNAGSNASNYLSPVVNVQTALTRYQDMKDFIDKVLNKDVDYGSIPGTSNKAVFSSQVQRNLLRSLVLL